MNAEKFKAYQGKIILFEVSPSPQKIAKQELRKLLAGEELVKEVRRRKHGGAFITFSRELAGRKVIVKLV